MNENKPKTSIQYQFTNIKLFYEVFSNWKNFKKILASGPNNMKNYLYSEWNKLADTLKENDSLEIVDIDKNVTVDDFNITVNTTSNNIVIFYFTFPNHQYADASSKYVALALTPNMPRYFTLEYGTELTIEHDKGLIPSKTTWFMGEFCIENGKKKHINYGKIDNMRLSYFAGRVCKLLEEEE